MKNDGSSPSPTEVERLEKRLNEVMSEYIEFMKDHPDYKGTVTSGYKLRERIGKTVRWIKQRDYEQNNGQVSDFINNFDAHNFNHIKTYIEEYLPQHMGSYLAKFHKLGLSHGFAHNKGGIRSHTGKQLGDKNCTRRKRNSAHKLLLNISEVPV